MNWRSPIPEKPLVPQHCISTLFQLLLHFISALLLLSSLLLAPPPHLPFFLLSASLYPSVGQRDILVLGFVSFPDAQFLIMSSGFWRRVPGYSHLPSGKGEVEAGRGKSLLAPDWHRDRLLESGSLGSSHCFCFLSFPTLCSPVGFHFSFPYSLPFSHAA